MTASSTYSINIKIVVITSMKAVTCLGKIIIYYMRLSHSQDLVADCLGQFAAVATFFHFQD